MRVHTYVIAVDSGAAPNYDKPCTTLAVCKPRIRKKANVGELVLAFAGKAVNPFEPHTVVWAGIVAEKLPFAEYWNDPRFATKKPDRSPTPDNFYRSNDPASWVPNPVHFQEQAAHDLNGQYVLAFNPSWHFGANGPPLPASFGLRMTHGRRGERLADLSDAEWRRLDVWLNQQTSSTRVETRKNSTCKPSTRRVTPPTPPPSRGRC